MAAPMVGHGASTVRGKKGNKSHFPVKNTITSPFLTEWPQLSNEDSSMALQKIKSAFVPHAARLAKESSKGKRKKAVSDEAKKNRLAIRSQLALGVNEVTRLLEQGKLELALVCRSAKPPLMTNHLMFLSATRNTPVLCLHGLSATLAPILNLKFLLAIGFKKSSPEDPSTFKDLINTIIAMTPPITVPWLQYNELTLNELRKVVTNVILKGKTERKSASTAKQKGKNKGMNKGQGSPGIPASEHIQAGTSTGVDNKASGNLDSGASAAVQQSQDKSDNVKQLLHSSDEKSESQTPSTSDTTPMTSKKRKLETDEEGTPSKKQTKTVLKADYKSVTVLPVKIIPKAMKNKKQLKKKRKRNKQKNK